MENLLGMGTRAGHDRARRYRQPLPRAFDRMLAAKNFQSGMQIVRQLEFALFDMALHGSFDPVSDDVPSLLARARGSRGQSRAGLHRFPHQPATYSRAPCRGLLQLQWAEVLSADAYAAFEEADGRRNRRSFRHEIPARAAAAAWNFKASAAARRA